MCGYLRHGKRNNFAMVHGLRSSEVNDLETKNWAVVAAAMEVKGYPQPDGRRAKAMAEGKADPMPTSYPAAPHSISVA